MSHARFAAAALGAALSIVPAVAFSQNYPAKPVRVIVPWPPGGSNDIVGRVVAQKMTELLGQQFVVENRGGASGVIGSDVVAKAQPDGYTIMVQSATHVANPHLFKKLPYDTVKDFTGITPLALQVGIIVVHPSLPVKSVKEFIALSKARPNQIAYASSGSGSFVHLGMALFASMTDTKMVHVPYKGGGPAAIALASGETQAMCATVGSVIPHIEGKRLKPLGFTSDHRMKQYPDIPAIGETVKGYEFTAWIGAFAPAGTPKPIVDRLNAEFKRVVSSPDAAKILGSQTLEPLHMTPEQYNALLKSEIAGWKKIVQERDIKIN